MRLATPHVAGVTAMLATLGLTGQDLTNAVLGSQSQKLVANGTTMNFGELDAQNAVLSSLGKAPLTSSPSTSQGTTAAPASGAIRTFSSPVSITVALGLATMIALSMY
mmetsp:Transcript_22880/g.19500  ORF Transcript_22880/g.19500 Transcript_22880/m.19500 type:complete len:108 (+) Transcript_22880:3-326(+)